MIRPARTLPPGSAPHVTVVVPCYNYGHFLADCVESIISQPGVRTSVHIVDDASPDNSFDVARQLAKRHPNVQATRNVANLGHIATYNRGLQQVESEYVVLLSADDMLAPGALVRATSLMERYPKVGLVYGHPQSFSTQPLETRAPFLYWSTWTGQAWMRAQFRRGLSIIYSPEVVVRTSVQKRVGYYRADLPHSGDLEMWLRIASVGDIGRINGPDQAYRRVHSASMMNVHYKSVLADLHERQRAYEICLENHGLKQKDKQALRATMRTRLAIEALGWAVDELAPGNTEAIRDATAFALSINPDVEDLPVWREFEASLQAGASRNVQQWFQLRRQLQNRLRWHSWRWLGI